ncbi:transposable element Tcb2 transposase [Trichonephila clavipes]|nr:transposable element Tcb2 transposase [Trichonephila clavipes]
MNVAQQKKSWTVSSVRGLAYKPLALSLSTSFIRKMAVQEDHQERGSNDRAASTCGPHSDSFNNTSRRRRVAIVSQTISRRLAEVNLKSKRSFRALPLTPEHRQLRLQWRKARSIWNVTNWQKVVLSDESRFVLGTDDDRVRVWRHPGPFINGHPGAIFQQDNALTHTARVAQDFLCHFQTLPWPARTPDLSPVVHVWYQLKRQMSLCHSVHDLELADHNLWAHLPQDNIRCLINSMPDRVAACTAVGDKPISRNRGGNERVIFGVRCVQRVTTDVLLDVFR